MSPKKTSQYLSVLPSKGQRDAPTEMQVPKQRVLYRIGEMQKNSLVFAASAFYAKKKKSIRVRRRCVVKYPSIWKVPFLQCRQV
jgi:hypothetical protein